jgi:hypothetical protein
MILVVKTALVIYGGVMGVHGLCSQNTNVAQHVISPKTKQSFVVLLVITW